MSNDGKVHSHLCWLCRDSYECAISHSFGSGDVNAGTKRPGYRSCPGCRADTLAAVDKLAVLGKRRRSVYS
jgi:hypothetical protein